MDMGGFDPRLIVLATSAATIVKILVDILRLIATLPQWVPPFAAEVLGIVAVGLMFEMAGTAIDTRQEVATVIVGGILAGAFAVGATAIQSARQPTVPTGEGKAAPQADVPTVGTGRIV